MNLGQLKVVIADMYNQEINDRVQYVRLAIVGFFEIGNSSEIVSLHTLHGFQT